MVDDLRLDVVTLQPARVVFGQVLSVYDIEAPSWGFHQLNLARVLTHLPVLLSAPQREVEPAVKHYCVEELLGVWRLQAGPSAKGGPLLL